jgi:hypothetical protein
MSRSLKALAAVALVGGIFSIAATPAPASKPSSRFYAPYRGAYVGGTAAHYNPRYACNGGRTYSFLGGWGCHYYFYPQYAPRRR